LIGKLFCQIGLVLRCLVTRRASECASGYDGVSRDQFIKAVAKFANQCFRAHNARGIGLWILGTKISELKHP
jgi:hypothetical protein